MVLDENVKKLFGEVRSMGAFSTTYQRKEEAKVEVYRLLELVDVNSTNSQGENLLLKAAYDRNVELVGHLVQKGANVHAKAKRTGLTPLLAASQNGGYVKAMKILIDAGADVHASHEVDGRQMNALSHVISSAVYTVSFEAVQMLLACGLKAFNDESRGTPLHVTARYCRSAPVLSLLLEHGVGDVAAFDHEGRTVLQCVLSSRNQDPRTSQSH